MAELQALLDEWIVAVWQNCRHEGLRDPLTPGRALTPNERYAALVAVAGYVPVPLGPQDYIELPVAAAVPPRLRAWQQALDGVLAVSPGQPDNGPGHAAVEIAIYPDVVWVAARSLRGRGPNYRTAV